MNETTLWFLALIIVTIILGGLNVFQVIFHYREKEDIFKKFMARDLHEAEFFKKGYSKDLKEKEAQLKYEREHPLSPTEIKKREEASKY